MDEDFRCMKCGQLKTPSEFNKKSSSPTGYTRRCRACILEDRRGREYVYKKARRLESVNVEDKPTAYSKITLPYIACLARIDKLLGL